MPPALRFAVTPLDELYATLRAYGYYPSAAKATAALEEVERLRDELADHSVVVYLGLQSAVRDARVTTSGATLEIEAKLTMHQTRYLMGMVSRKLASERPRQK